MPRQAGLLQTDLTSPRCLSIRNPRRPEVSECLRFDEADELSWHQRLLQGDRDVVDTAFRHLLPLLLTAVRRAFSRTDPALVADAVEDALMEYARQPERFQPSRGVPLTAFLRLAALRNASNLVRGESRRLARERRLVGDPTSPLAGQLQTASVYHVQSAALETALAQAVRPDERVAVALWLAGERRTTIVATALGAGGLPLIDQRRAVKQLKERIRRRLERLLGDGVEV